MFRAKRSFNNLVLVEIFTILLIILILPRQSEQNGIKKLNQQIKTKNKFPFHKITHLPLQNDDLDADIQEFFEKVHHASFQTTEKQIEDDDEEEKNIEEEKQKLVSGFFSWIFATAKDEDNENPNFLNNNEDENDDENYCTKNCSENSVKNVNNNYNSIINWLETFIQPSKNSKTTKFENEKSSDNIFVEYLNRWPFNVLFSLGKTNSISIPKRTFNYKLKNEPISETDFESMLASLPSFFIDHNYVKDIDCKQQIQILQRQLKGHKMWTLQMLDATAKISSGILRGNVNQIGDFDLCTNIKTAVKVTKEVSLRIKGKYCLAHIEIQTTNANLKLPVHLAQGRGLWNSHLNDPSHFAPRYSIIDWGICIPHSCHSFVIQDMINRYLKPYNRTGLFFHVDVNDNDCVVRNNSLNFQNKFKINEGFYFTISYFMAFFLLVLLSILIENYIKIKVMWIRFWDFIKPMIIKKKTYLKNFFEIAKKCHAEVKAEINEQMKIYENKQRDDEVDKIQEKPLSSQSQQEHGEHKFDSFKENLEQDLLKMEEVRDSIETKTEDLNQKQSSFLMNIALSFLPKRTLTFLFDVEGSDTDFAIFHLLKILCSCMLYFCLKYVMLGHLPLLNRDKLIKSLNNSFSVFYRSPLIYFDILLIISGFLKSHQLCIELEKNRQINTVKAIIIKLLRYQPALYAVILFQTWILPYLESGPYWNNIIGTQSKLCKESLWRQVFGIQNAINFEDTCSPMTLQSSVEIQLFLLAPLIVWLTYCNSVAGFFFYGGLHMISVAARYSRTSLEHLSMTIFHGIHVSKFYRSANLLFSSPIPRATPFLIGIGAGILCKTLQIESIGLSKLSIFSGWVITAVALCYCFSYPIGSTSVKYVYDSSEAASYASWSPLLLGLSVVWIFIMVPTRTLENKTNSLHRFLTVRPILFLSRITYPIQLVMYVAVLYTTAKQKESKLFSINDIVNLEEIAIIFIYAFILAFFIDIPMQRVIKLVLNELFPDKLILLSDNQDEIQGKIQEEVTEGEPSESEITYEYKAKEDFVAGGIWGGEPKQEENPCTRKKNSLNLFSENDSFLPEPNFSKTTLDETTELKLENEES